MMGDISGIAMARIIKKNTSLADIPIIFCTARDADADMIEGLETGAVRREDLKRSAVRILKMIRSNTVLESK